MVERSLEWCRAPRRARQIVTMNVAGLQLMKHDDAMRRACEEADLMVADGVPLVWASRLLGRPLPGRVAGVDLMQALLAAGARERLRVYFLGAREEVVQEVVRRCGERFPGLVVAGARERLLRRIERRDRARFAGRARPASSSAYHRPSGALRPRARAGGSTPVMLGVGGSFDVMAGRIRRAPS